MPANDNRDRDWDHRRDRQDEVLASIEKSVSQQSLLSAQHQSQINTMQQQLNILTDVATRLAVIEERREQDRDNIKLLFTQVDAVRGRVDVLHTQVTAKFPVYDSLAEVYKAMNAKLWTAILTGVLGLVIAGGKVVLGLGG